MWPWLLTAAEAAPAVGRFAMQAIPYAAAAFGAAPKLKEGDIPGAILQGGLGYLGGTGIKGLAGLGGRFAGGLGARAVGGAANVMAPDLSATALRPIQSAVGQVARAAVPVAGLGLMAQQALAGGGGQGVVQGGGGGLLGAGQQALGAAGAMGVPGLGANQPQNPANYPFVQGALPPNLGSFGPGQQRTAFDALNPTGAEAYAGLMQEKEMDRQVRNMMKQANVLIPISEGEKKAEFMRGLAANAIRTNIQTQQQNILGGLATARQMGLTGAQQIGNILGTQYTYS